MTPDRRKEPFVYQFINPKEYRDILKNNPTWYVNTPFADVIDTFILGKDTGVPHWRDTRMEIVRLVAEALRDKEIVLGNWAEFQNDDDRWHKRIREMFPRERDLRRARPDMVIIHHTAMPSETPLEIINALHFLRLYVPPFRDTFKKGDLYQPISSGHFTDMPLWKGQDTTQPIFIAYHWGVKQDGTPVRLLKDEYTGFHAGDYQTNCRSIGIVILDDLQETSPSEAALREVAALTKQYKPSYVIGHGSVMLKTKEGEITPLETECPGALFYVEKG